MNKNPSILSDVGIRRRNSMKTELRNEFLTMHRHRKNRRFALSAAAVMMLCASALWWNFGWSQNERTIEIVANAEKRQRDPRAAATQRMLDRYVSYTQPEVVDRYVVENNRAGEQIVLQEFADPDELLDLMASAGHRANLAQVGGQLRVILLDAGELDE